MRQHIPLNPRSCICRPAGVGASGLQRCQGARSLRDRQLPTALPALDRTSTHRHGANNRPKGHSGPSACKFHLCQSSFSPKVDGFQGNGWKSSTLGVACFEKVDGFWENSRKSSTFPVFGSIEHSIQLGFCVITCFSLSNEKSSAGGRVNAAGSESGMPVSGLSNRSPHPPASTVCAGAQKAFCKNAEGVCQVM